MIADVRIVELIVHVDDRGYLIEIARREGDESHAVIHRFGQVYLVGSIARGTIRAFHKHRELWDWFFVSHGSAKFVLVDDREGSPTQGEKNSIIAGDRWPRLIIAPPGVFHGWISLEDDTQLVSVASETYNREEPDEERVPPNHFGDVWTVRGR